MNEILHIIQGLSQSKQYSVIFYDIRKMRVGIPFSLLSIQHFLINLMETKRDINKQIQDNYFLV